MSNWPRTLYPCFFVETCFNCSGHQWCTRHQEERYLNAALALRDAIVKETNIDVKFILINEFHRDLGVAGTVNLDAAAANTQQSTTYEHPETARLRPYQPSEYFQQIYHRLLISGIDQIPQQKIWRTDLRMGAFEVYFMGVRLFSKIKSS